MKQSILFFLLISSAFSLSAQDQLFSPVELKADLAIYEKSLAEVHPNAFQWYPKDSFDIWIDAAEKKLTRPMTSKEFRKMLLPIHQKVGCGHSRFASPQADIKAEKKRYKAGAARNYVPFNGKVINGQFYVLKDYTEDEQLPKGTEILKIGQYTMPQILDSLSLIVTSDGYNTTHFLNAVSTKFPALYKYYFGPQDVYTIEYKDSLDQVRSATLSARLITKAQLKAKAKALKKNPPPPDTTIVKTKQLIFKKKKYRFSQSLQDSSVYILRIPSFMGNKGLRFHKKIIKYLNALPQVSTLVIDVRNNGGGDFKETATLASMLCTEAIQFELSQPTKLEKSMYKHLTKTPFGRVRHRFFLGLFSEEKEKGEISKIKLKFEADEKIHFDGPLYVLINGYSFSASSVLSSFLRDQDRAIFIGEETGGGFHGTNAMSMPYLVFPNSSVRVRMPMWKLRQVVKGENLGHGIYPDVRTTWTIEDVLDNKDVDMETLLVWKEKMYKEFKKSKS